MRNFLFDDSVLDLNTTNIIKSVPLQKIFPTFIILWVTDQKTTPHVGVCLGDTRPNVRLKEIYPKAIIKTVGNRSNLISHREIRCIFVS